MQRQMYQRSLNQTHINSVRSKLRDRVNQALSSLNQTFRLTYEEATEIVTGLPMDAVNKLRTFEQPVDATFITGEAQHFYFQSADPEFTMYFRKRSSVKQNTATLLAPGDTGRRLLEGSQRMLNIIQAYKDICGLLPRTEALSLNLLHSLNPILVELVQDLIALNSEIEWATPRDVNLSSEMTAVYYKMRQHTTTIREIIIAPTQFQPRVIIGDYERSVSV